MAAISMCGDQLRDFKASPRCQSRLIRETVTTYANPRNLQTTYIRKGFGEVKRQLV